MAHLSAFADEISPDLDVHLENLAAQGVEAIELRGVAVKALREVLGDIGVE